MNWQNNVGSVLVVRSADQDVSVQQVEALCHFCQFKIQPLFENALGYGLVRDAEGGGHGLFDSGGVRGLLCGDEGEEDGRR